MIITHILGADKEKCAPSDSEQYLIGFNTPNLPFKMPRVSNFPAPVVETFEPTTRASILKSKMNTDNYGTAVTPTRRLKSSKNSRATTNKKRKKSGKDAPQ